MFVIFLSLFCIFRKTPARGCLQQLSRMSKSIEELIQTFSLPKRYRSLQTRHFNDEPCFNIKLKIKLVTMNKITLFIASNLLDAAVFLQV